MYVHSQTCSIQKAYAEMRIRLKTKKISAIHQMTENPHLNLYHLDALDRKGETFDYYFASRNSKEKLKLFTKGLEPEGIVIYGLTEEAAPRLVLIKEYRYPLDEEIYALPAGLVDAGETPGMAAVREMKEETGLSFLEYTGGDSCFRRPFFMGPGFTDESSCAVYGTVRLEGKRQECEGTEEIQVVLADKGEVRRILSEERVSLRGAYLMMQYLHMDAEKPFAFLE